MQLFSFEVASQFVFSPLQASEVAEHQESQVIDICISIMCHQDTTLDNILISDIKKNAIFRLVSIQGDNIQHM